MSSGFYKNAHVLLLKLLIFSQLQKALDDAQAALEKANTDRERLLQEVRKYNPGFNLWPPKSLPFPEQTAVMLNTTRRGSHAPLEPSSLALWEDSCHCKLPPGGGDLQQQPGILRAWPHRSESWNSLWRCHQGWFLAFQTQSVKNVAVRVINL